MLTDPVTGETFGRPAGTDGDEDVDPDEEEADERPTPTTAPPTTLPPATLPPVTEPPPPPTEPPTQSFGARAILESALAQCSGVVFPFEEHVSESISVERTGQTAIERVTLIGTTAGGNQQVFSWLVDTFSESLTPEGNLANEAAQYCPALGG